MGLRKKMLKTRAGGGCFPHFCSLPIPAESSQMPEVFYDNVIQYRGYYLKRNHWIMQLQSFDWLSSQGLLATSIYPLNDLGVLRNLIGPLSRNILHCLPPRRWIIPLFMFLSRKSLKIRPRGRHSKIQKRLLSFTSFYLKDLTVFRRKSAILLSIVKY